MTAKEKELTEAIENQDFSKARILLEEGVRLETGYDEAVEDAVHSGSFEAAIYLLEVRDTFKIYEETGKVGDSLLPLFSQAGHWWGMGFEMGSFGNLEYETIAPESTTKLGHPRHLLTSFVFEGQGSISLDYEHIDGDLYASQPLDLIAPNLKSVGGRISAGGAKRAFLPKLESSKGSIILEGAKTLDLPELLWTEGDLIARNCLRLFAPKLNRMGGALFAPKAKGVNLESLEKTGFTIDVDSLERVHFPSLISCEGNFSATKSQSVDLPRLEYVGANLVMVNATKILCPCLNYVRGRIEVNPKVYKRFATHQLITLLRRTDDESTYKALNAEVKQRKILEKITAGGLVLEP